MATTIKKIQDEIEEYQLLLDDSSSDEMTKQLAKDEIASLKEQLKDMEMSKGGDDEDTDKPKSKPKGKRGRPKGIKPSVSVPKKKGKRGRPKKVVKVKVVKPKKQVEPKADGGEPDCDELLKRWTERRAKAKTSNKKRKTKPVFRKIASDVVDSVEKAIKNVPKAEIKEKPKQILKKFDTLRASAEQFLKAFRSVLGDDYKTSDAEKELKDLEVLIKGIQKRYSVKYGLGDMVEGRVSSAEIRDYWQGLTINQQDHFLADHSSEFKNSGSWLSKLGQPYENLPLDIQMAIQTHLEEGRYGKGDMVEGDEKHDSVAFWLKEGVDSKKWVKKNKLDNYEKEYDEGQEDINGEGERVNIFGLENTKFKNIKKSTDVVDSMIEGRYGKGDMIEGDDAIQEELSHLVGDFNESEYKAFCYEHDIDEEDGQEMSDFIYSQTNNRCKEIIKEIEDGYYSDGDKFAKGNMVKGDEDDFYEVYDEETGKSLLIQAIDQDDANSMSEEIDFEAFEDGDELEYGWQDKFAKGNTVSFYTTKKPSESVYILYDFARSSEQAKNMLKDLAEGSPIAHKSTSEGGEYNIYVKKGSVFWR